MGRYTKRISEGKKIFVGIDMHKKRWHITILDEASEIWHGDISGHWDALRAILDRYRGCRIWSVYEAGCFGFWLYDRLTEYSVTRPFYQPDTSHAS